MNTKRTEAARVSKALEVRRIKMNATTPKSALIQLWRDLDRVGAVQEANALSAILSKLEAWQNR